MHNLIIKTLTLPSIRASYISTLKTAFQLNKKLIKSIFENIDTSRKKNNEFSKLATKKRHVVLSDFQRKLILQDFLLRSSKTC